MEKYTKAQIRRFMVRYHGLDILDSFGDGKIGIMSFFQHIGSIQNDPLNVVGKNAELVLHARFDTNTARALDELLYKDRLLVDGFDKESSIYAMQDWKKFSPVRGELTNQNVHVLEYRGLDNALNDMESIYAQFIDETVFNSKDFKIGSVGKSAWGPTSYSSCILNHLWCQGRIGIHSRNGTMKRYAHIESLVPRHIYHEPELSFDVFYAWYLLRRLDELGMYWLKRGAGWQGFHMKDMKKIIETVEMLVGRGDVKKVYVEDIKDPFYLSMKAYSVLQTSLDKPIESPQIRFIAPLDNFIWDRKLIKELFDFDYTWEVYVPKNKRKFGYYVLPILYGDELIGRVEPQQNKKKMFIINNLWFEDEAYDNDTLHSLIQKEIERHNRNFS